MRGKERSRRERRKEYDENTGLEDGPANWGSVEFIEVKKIKGIHQDILKSNSKYLSYLDASCLNPNSSLCVS